MTTQTEVEVPPAMPTVDFRPAAPRGVLKTGMPTEGYWLLAGLAKAGKTTLAASIPDSVILELEQGGADRVAGNIQEIPDLKTFRNALRYYYKDTGTKAIVIDGLDLVLNYIADEVAQSYNLESLSERKEGVNGFEVWREFEKRIEGLASNFQRFGRLVVLLSHFPEPKLDNEGKLVITQAINAPSKKASSYLCSHADAIGVVSKKRFGEASQYIVRFHGEGVVGAYGSRIPELEDKTFIIPKTNPWSAIEAAFKPKETESIKATAKVAGRK